jgi:ankyrin repeat protein
MELSIKKLIDNKDYEGLRQALSGNPGLANEGIPLDDKPGSPKAHPLHRICDAVFARTYTDKEAVEIAKIFLECGADVNGNVVAVQQDTPLLAASSLYADEVALLYINHGADIHHQGCAGGTALHWASYCGRDKVVKRLIEAGAEINKRCIEYQSTPLLWALHALKEENEGNHHHQVECIRLLVEAGANKNIPNAYAKIAADYLDENDDELKKILNT